MIRKPRKPLSKHRPDLAAEWHFEKNAPLTPDQVGTGIKKRVWWKCPNGDDHEWQASISSRVAGRGCPACAGYQVSVTNSLAACFPSIAAEWHPTKNGSLSPEDIVHGTNEKVWWKCANGEDHEWEAVVVPRTRIGAGCPFCAGKSPSASNNLRAAYPELASEWHPVRNGNLKPYQVTVGSNKKVWWKCPQGPDHEWKAAIGSRASGRGCPFCAGFRASETNSLSSQFPDIANEWHPRKNGKLRPNDLTTGSSLKVWWMCSANPSHEWKAPPQERVVGHGCPYCSGNRLSPENSVAGYAPELIEEWDFERNSPTRPEEVSRGSNTKYWWICRSDQSHRWKAPPHTRTEGIGCPECSRPLRSSKGEMRLLKNLRNEYLEEQIVHHAQPVWLGRQHLDIYFPGHNLAIEFHGRQHFEPVVFFGGEEAFERNQERDQRKRDLCSEHGCSLLEFRKGDSLEDLLLAVDRHLRNRDT